ncbi:tRNA pseudouridine synthase A [Mesoplasma lactucae ATCC 49193]|uniref:tRNA pseudouridine synthase A n=2 Tax=Mesoplasma lactucae TaxID=138853 RepID=A0A291ISR3_9MOLU|nr:tRNA pseudouridine(38-40) synthase TruA [Mesoplasma lactucae ATCC 49193]ATZ20357.1 tRNA pseudouridine synthase A [Mesoplasma lactucae ATCC 49193]MCL8216528.1 tRNA pseudouridine synthase A [Mesoplasma lactucae ATCC 49193]
MLDFKYHYLLTISYDGSSFNGWIIQNNKRTIQGELTKALNKLTKKADFSLLGASKTDAKVHALDQKVLLGVDFEIKNLSLFKRGLNRSLPLDVRVNDLITVDKDFKVRDVKQKTYRYTINDQNFDLFTQRYELNWFEEEIDINKLQEIFNLFVGSHDFYLFSGLSEKEKADFKTTRDIEEIKVLRNKENKIEIYFKAKGFIRYQIRMIVAASLQCYLNSKRSSVELIKERLNGKGDKSPFNIDAKGLCLMKIEY